MSGVKNGGDTKSAVVILSDDRLQEWDDFVRTVDGGTFFHLSGWKKVMESVFGCRCYYLYCERDGKIQGILPLVHFRNWIAGNALVSTPFLVYGGPIGADLGIVQLLVDRARCLAEDLGVDYLELRNRVPISGVWTTKDLYVTFRKSIAPEPEDNLKCIPRKQRAIVRKGIKAELDVSWNFDLDRFYGVFCESYRNLGTPIFDRELFRKIQEIFPDNCRMTTVSKDGVDLSSVISFIFGKEIVPYYGGGTADARKWNANDFMYWAVMENAAKQGMDTFDYGRSKIDTGSYRFKKHWGFVPEPLYYQYHLVKAKKLPDVSPSNPKYSLPIAIWKKLPLSLTKLIGPSIARRVG